VDDRIYDRIRWHARRGLLENDILLGRFFDLELMALAPDELQQLDLLLALGDNELLEILMGRKKCGSTALQPIADRIVAASAGKLNTYS
jgi:succinate dehydrogenase flavin-adding protein (antitoxin of CptAB toxin-antitoxin module)